MFYKDYFDIFFQYMPLICDMSFSNLNNFRCFLFYRFSQVTKQLKANTTRALEQLLANFVQEFCSRRSTDNTNRHLMAQRSLSFSDGDSSFSSSFNQVQLPSAFVLFIYSGKRRSFVVFWLGGRVTNFLIITIASHRRKDI